MSDTNRDNLANENTRLKTELEEAERLSQLRHKQMHDGIERLETELNVANKNISRIESELKETKKEAKRVWDGIVANAPKCGACAECLFTGATNHEHDEDCPITQNEKLREKLDSVTSMLSRTLIWPKETVLQFAEESIRAVIKDGDELRAKLTKEST